MKISVIIPTFNRANFILNCIQSVQKQTYKIDEIIVIDDGSNDNTKELLRHLDITYIQQPNKGVSSARNRGILLAKNEWIAFLDSDDVWETQKIEKHVTYHQQHQEILASFSDELWVRDGKIIALKSHQQKEEPTFLNSLRLCKIGTSTFFSHKKIFDTVGMFDESLNVCEDYDFWLRVLKEFPIKLINEKLTIKYAGHKNQLSFDTKLIDTFRIKALKKHLDSEFKSAVVDELIYKTSLLLKGAKKHHNEAIIREYEKELNYFLRLK